MVFGLLLVQVVVPIQRLLDLLFRLFYLFCRVLCALDEILAELLRLALASRNASRRQRKDDAK
jgi:hypothetical protein